MIQIPDAPWIRDAEINGMPFAEKPIICPVCGAEEPEYLYKQDGSVIGCSECVECIMAEDYEEGENGDVY